MPEPISDQRRAGIDVPEHLMRAAELAAYEQLKVDHANPPDLWMALVRAAVVAVFANLGERETQYAARYDGRDYRITEWQATDAAEWAPGYQLISRPVRACGDWEATEPPPKVTPGWDGVRVTPAPAATHTAPQEAAVPVDGSNACASHSEAQEAAG